MCNYFRTLRADEIEVRVAQVKGAKKSDKVNFTDLQFSLDTVGVDDLAPFDDIGIIHKMLHK